MQSNRNEQGKWLPGESGNPNGRPKLAEKMPPELREVAVLNKMRFQKVLYDLIRMTKGEILELSKDEEVTVLESLVARILVRGIQEGNPVYAEFILNRLCGKVTEVFEHSGRMTFEELVGGSFAEEGDKE